MFYFIWLFPCFVVWIWLATHIGGIFFFCALKWNLDCKSTLVETKKKSQNYPTFEKLTPMTQVWLATYPMSQVQFATYTLCPISKLRPTLCHKSNLRHTPYVPFPNCDIPPFLKVFIIFLSLLYVTSLFCNPLIKTTLTSKISTDQPHPRGEVNHIHQLINIYCLVGKIKTLQVFQIDHTTKCHTKIRPSLYLVFSTREANTWNNPTILPGKRTRA